MFARTPPTTIQTWSKTLEGLRNKDILVYLPTPLWPRCSCLVLDRGTNTRGALETTRTPPLLKDSTVLPEYCECWAYGNGSLLPLFETSFWLGYLANADSTLNSVRIVFWQELFFRLHNSRLAVLLKRSTLHFSTPLTLPPFLLIRIFFSQFDACRDTASVEYQRRSAEAHRFTFLLFLFQVNWKARQKTHAFVE